MRHPAAWPTRLILTASVAAAVSCSGGANSSTSPAGGTGATGGSGTTGGSTATQGVVFSVFESGSVRTISGVAATVTYAGGSKALTSDANGVVNALGMPVGSYSATFTKSGYNTATSSGTVAAGQAEGVVVNMTPSGTGGTGGATSFGSVAFAVRDAAGALIPNVTLELKYFDNTLTYATSSATGSGTINSIAIGNFTLTASKAGYTSASVTGYVAANQTSGANLVLAGGSGAGGGSGGTGGGTTGGVGTISYSVRDASGALVSNVAIDLKYAGNTQSYSTSSSTGTGTISSVATGAFTITATKAGFNAGTATGTVTANQTTTVSITMTGGSTGAGLGSTPIFPDVSTTIITSGNTFNNLGGNYTQSFTVSQTTRVVMRVAADYQVQAAVFAPSQLTNFQNNRTFTANGNFFDRENGTVSVDLTPGTWYVGIRNMVAGTNSTRFALEYAVAERITPSGNITFTFNDYYYNRLLTVAAGGAAIQEFEINDNVRYFLNGVNSAGLLCAVIPASEISKFSSGQNYQTYGQYTQSTSACPGPFELRLPKGNYALVFKNTSNTDRVLTFTLERWLVRR
jgi:hypothetical protein